MQARTTISITWETRVLIELIQAATGENITELAHRLANEERTRLGITDDIVNAFLRNRIS